jgi:uncharacterized surface protein with fasciclin (FAS1) repeats
MMRSRIHSLCWLATLLAHHGACISLLGVLQSQPELSTLYGYVNASANATSLLNNANNFTFFAPSNTAIASLLASNPSALSPDLVDATLQYALVNGGFTSLSFTNVSQFVPTNLNNATYANVTGGQRLELVLDANGEPQTVSGNKSISHPATELVCVGGFVHIIDQVLTIPLTTVFELTAANLEFFTSILNVGGYLNDSNAGYVNGILDVPNVTYFIPNSAEALANATNIIKVNGTSAELEALFEYHIVRDFLGYSPLLTNGTSLKTAQGENITITIQDGQMFVNSAKVIETDLIVANGVVHVLDSLLDRFDQSLPPPPPTTSSASSSSTPTTSPTPPPPTITPGSDTSATNAGSSKSSGLSIGAKIGIGIGVPIFALALMAVLTILILRYKQAKQDRGMSDNGSAIPGSPDLSKQLYGMRSPVPTHDGMRNPTTGMAEYPGSGNMGTTTSVSGPNIPARSPNRTAPGGGDNYF